MQQTSRYIAANFENIFSKYARTQPDKLSLGEIWDMTEANRLAFDPYGWYNGLYESSCVLLFIDKLRFLLKS